MSAALSGRRILVTGGAGFIGANFVYWALQEGAEHVAVLDALTYAACPATLDDARRNPRFAFREADVCDPAACRSALEEARPDWVLHLAAESHVDRSIDDPAPFVRTNVLGTATLLEALLAHWANLPDQGRRSFRFLSASTDEVFGSAAEGEAFQEDSPYAPHSPYAASKAAADHLVFAYRHTYGLPGVVTYCGNNYGPFQFPEKLVPLMALAALEGGELPIYGDGHHVRDWIHVTDHCRGLGAIAALEDPAPRYCLSGRNRLDNLAMVRRIADETDRQEQRPVGSAWEKHRLVEDRPGHDRRYALDPARLQAQAGWKAQRTLEDGMAETVRWYRENRAWVEEARRRSGYRGERLGLRGGPRVRRGA